MAEESLNIDNCVDAAGIRSRLKELRRMREYANDLAPRISIVIGELETRLSKLGEDVDYSAD